MLSVVVVVGCLEKEKAGLPLKIMESSEIAKTREIVGKWIIRKWWVGSKNVPTFWVYLVPRELKVQVSQRKNCTLFME